MKKSILFCLGLLTSTLVITGCQSPSSSINENVVVEGISIESKDNIRNIKEGETLLLSVKAYPIGASSEVTWSSSDESIATVNENGLVTAIKKGNVNIIATSKSNSEVSQSFALIVEKNEVVKVNPTRVSIYAKDNAKTLQVAKTLELTIKVEPENADTSIEWSSSDKTIATVSNRGLVTGVKAGKVIITATSLVDDTIKDSIELTIEKSDDPIVNLDWAKMEYTTHADYYSADVENDTPMKIKGVVTHISPSDGGKVNYFIQNGIDGYYVYAQDTSIFPVTLGESYEVGGYKKYYRGLNEIVNVEHFVKLDEKLTYTVNHLTEGDITDRSKTDIYHASLVSGSAVMEKGSVNDSKAYSLYAKVNGYSTTFRIDPSYMTSEEFAAINSKFKGCVAGTNFEFKGYLTAFNYYGLPPHQVQVVRASDIEIQEASAEQLLDAAKGVLSISTTIPLSKNSISLPSSIDGFNGMSVSWASDNACIDVTTGNVTHGTTNQKVTLTATLKLEDKTVTKVFEVTVFANDTNTYETMVSLDLEDAADVSSYNMSATKDTYEEGNINLSGHNWKLASALIACDKNDVYEGRFGIRAETSKGGFRIEILDDGDYRVVEFDVSVYGADAPALLKVQYSSDSGATWTTHETVILVDFYELETFRIYLPQGTNRVALVGEQYNESGNRLSFDNIKLMK